MTDLISPVVRPLQQSDSGLLEALFQFYGYDFSELEATGSNRLALNAHGKFDITIPDAATWMSPGKWGYLFFEAGHPAGFALVNTLSPSGRDTDFNMAEFFVARKYRRQGFGTKAVHDVISRHRGRWEIGVIESNTVAQIFWPKAIVQAPDTSSLQKIASNGAKWPGPVWTFSNIPKREDQEPR